MSAGQHPARRGRSAALLALAALLILAAPVARAHADILHTFPPAGARLATAPAEAWVEFTDPEDIASVRLQVLDRDLREVSQGPVRFDGTRATVALRPGLPDGGYLVKYGFTSKEDGHGVSQSTSFAVGVALDAAKEPDAPGPYPWLLAAGKALSFVALALATGAAATRAFVLPGADAVDARLRALERAGAVLLVAGAAASLAGQASAAGAGVAGYALSSAAGLGAAARVVLAVVLVGLALARPTAWRASALLATLGAFVLVQSAFGHTAAALPLYPLGVLVAAVHLASVLAWTGGLLCLALILRSGGVGPGPAVEASRRFSRLATVAVVAMSATGVVMLGAVLGWDVRGWGRYLGTPYGTWLAVMVVLGLLMMGLGAVNRYRFLAALVHSPGPERRRAFQRRVLREGSVGLAVLLVAAGLTNLPPTVAGGVAEEVYGPCGDAEDPIACYVDVLKIIQSAQGSDAAFTLLMDMTAADPSLSKHLHYLGHELGAHALAMHGGIQETLDSCSLKAAQGCLDGAIEAYVLSVPEVDDAMLRGICRPGTEYWNWTCHHGVGHGVALLAQYNLTGSLAICDRLEEGFRDACYQGAVMEHMLAYTGQTLQHAEQGGYSPAELVERRPEDRSYPCSVLTEPYLRACWLYQGHIFLYWNKGDYVEAFARCDAAPQHNVTCGVGIGNIIAENAYMDPAAVRTFCRIAESHDMRVACVQGFVGWTLENSADPSQGISLCRGVASGYKSACYYYLGAFLRRSLPPSDMADFCALAESGHQEKCRLGARLDHA